MNKITAALTATVAAAGTVVGAPLAFAAGPDTTELGAQAQLVNGDVVQGWTVSGLAPSTDAIPYPVAGTLWEATASDKAIQGSVIPIVSNLNARAANGETYRALFQVATPQGVNPATLAPGQETSGKVYFDVTGEKPDSVVYNDGGRDLAVWRQPAAAPQVTSNPAPAYRGGSSYTAETPASASAATATEGAPTAAPAAAGAATTPAPAAAGMAPLPAGSTGTPLPAGSTGTPLPAGSQGTPIPGEGGPAPAPAGSAGTPLPAGAPAPTTPAEPAPIPASTQGTALPAGSQATPAVPTTTPVPVP